MQRYNEPTELQLEFSKAYPSLVLASSSPNRRGLLEIGGSKVTVFSPDVDEERHNMTPVEAMLSIAEAKLNAYLNSPAFDENLPAIAADTLVMIDDILIGKPKDEEDARAILSHLSGRTQTVYTATGLYIPGKGAEVFIDSADVIFYKLSQSDIDSYIATGEWSGAAGGYRLQKTGHNLVERIEGDWTTVVGLPLKMLINKLA